MSRCHVAVFAFPYSSHPIPLLHITKRLAILAGPEVHFTFFNTALSNDTFFHSFNTQIPSNLTAVNVWDGIPEAYVFNNRHYEEIDFYMKASPETLRKAVIQAERETGIKLTCVMGDSFLWFAADIAEEIGVPWVAIWTASEHALAAHVYTDILRQKIGSQEEADQRKDELLTFIPGFSNVRVRDLPSGIVSGNFDTTFAKMLHKMGKVLPRAAAVIANTYDEFNPKVTADLRSIFKRYIGGGPFSLLNMSAPNIIINSSKSSSNQCISWLDRKPAHSVVYIALGTSVRPSSDELTAIAAAVEETGVYFLWSLKSEHVPDLPGGFVDRVQSREMGLVVPWTPQVEILSHTAVGVFMTHLGWGSLTESVGGGGVPMIGRPFFGDQLLNGRLIEEEWRVGVMVPNGVFTKDGVVRALDKVILRDEGGERGRVRENAKRLRDMAMAAVASGGSSFRNLNTLVREVLT